MIYLSIFLAFSVIINVILVMYSRYLLRKIAESEVFLVDATDMILKFKEHLTIVHELEMFYGDETLGALMRHSSEIVEVIDEYQSNSILVEDTENTDQDQGELTSGS